MTEYTIIPAHPDWDILTIYGEESDYSQWVDHQPIIAWRVDQKGNAIPVTLDGEEPQPGYALSTPRGSVIIPGGATYGSYMEWTDRVIKRRPRSTERRGRPAFEK